MARSYEVVFNIGGNVARSFSNTFNRANSSLTGLRNQSRQVQRQLNQLGNDFRRGRISEDQYRAATESLTNQMERLERAQKRIKSLKSTFSTGVDKVKHAAGIAAVATAAAGAAVAFQSLNKAADFQQQITKVGVIAGASAKDVKRLSDSALALGANTSLSSSEVATAMGELAAKGMNTNKIIGAMPGIIAAAESSGEDLAMTSDVVTSALNAFNLKASAAGHIADVMAMSANKTAAGVADLGYSFKYAAPVAKTLGISLEELASVTGIMVDKGLSGEQAGTSLRMALIRLSKPPKAAQKALAKLNISVTDSHKKFKSIAQISEDWTKATKKLTQTQKVQYAATIFGTEAATGMLNLFSAGPKEINEMTKALDNSTGSAKKAAAAMKNNYAGSLEQLKGSIESAQISFATPILPVFQDVFNSLTGDISGNMGKIENAGKKTAAALREIFEPIIMKKPVMSAAEMRNPELAKEYQSQMAKYNSFQGMDFGDKVVNMLDTASDKIEKWLSGSGGKSMNKIFSKLGEIAAKAWWDAFSGAVQSSASNLMQGNYAAAGGMGALAWVLGGGLMVGAGKGVWSAGKFGVSALKGRGGTAASSASNAASNAPNAANAAGNATSATAAGAANTSRILGSDGSPIGGARAVQILGADGRPISSGASAAAETAATASGASKVLSVGGKIIGKAALPVAVAVEGYNVYKAKDKTKAVAQGIGSVGGGWGGATAGAALGTLIFPGVGTVVGGILGGIGGGLGGRAVAGSIVDHSRVSAAQSAPTGSKVVDTSPLNKAYADLSTNVVTATSVFSDVKKSGDLVKSNLDMLTMYTGQASGWLASLSGIQTAGERVIKALNDLESRIKSIKLPSKRVSYDG